MSIVRIATRVVPCTLAVAVGYSLGGCSIEAPELPTFDTQIRVPISEERYTLAELVEDIDNIVVDSSEVRIELSGDIDPVGVDDELAVTLDGTSYAAEIGAFELPDDLGTNVEFGFDELAPPGTPTGSTIVPPFAFNPPEREASGIDSFTEVTFASGELVLQITNVLPVPLAGACGPPLTIVARDAASGDVVFTFFHGDEIAPGETVEGRADLSGKTMGNTVRILLSGCSEGSGGQAVDVSDTDHVEIDVSFEDVTAESAVAEIPAQTFGTTGTSSWDDDMALSAASIESGTAPVALENTTSLDATVHLRFPGFTTPAGDTLGFDLALPAGSQGNTMLDFAGVTFSSVDPVTTISYETRVVTPGSGGSHVPVSSTDQVIVDVGDIDLSFAWVEGVPEAIEREVGPFTEPIEWPDEADGFRPAVANLLVEVTSEIGAQAMGRLVVRASSDAETDTIVANAVVEPGALGSPVTTQIVIDQTNSRILDLLAFYPTEIEVSGTFTVGDGQEVVRLDRGAELSGSYGVTAPFAFTVEGGEIQLDAIDVDLEQDVRDLLRDHVSGVSIETHLSNGFPFGASVVVSFAGDSAAVYAAPEVVLDAVSAESAEVDPVSGKTLEPTSSADVLFLDQTEIETIAQPTIYIGANVSFAPSAGVIVMQPSDEVVVTTVLTIDLTVDEGVFDETSRNGGGR